MTLANNAIYSPGKTAVNSSSGYLELSSQIMLRECRYSIDNSAFFNGGSSASAFANAIDNEFWPKSDSLLIGTAGSSLLRMPISMIQSV